MGASGWHYITTYDKDANVALQKLRQEVFESGRYGDPFANISIWQGLSSGPFILSLLFVVSRAFLTVHRFFSWLARGCRGPRSIDEALDIAGASGTHSILDIEACSQNPGHGRAYRLQHSRVLELFGTEHPTVDDLERVGWHAAAARLGRWQAVYFPIYEQDSPVSLVFVGCSGD